MGPMLAAFTGRAPHENHEVQIHIPAMRAPRSTRILIFVPTDFLKVPSRNFAISHALE
jgi:hypothetical protein